MPATAAFDELDAAAFVMLRRARRARSRFRLRRRARQFRRSSAARPTRTASLRWRAAARPSGRDLEPDRRKRLILRDVEPSAAGELERRKEARRKARTAELRVLRSTAGSFRERSSRAPCRSSSPTRSIASSSVMTERAWTTCIAGLGARANHAIGRKQVEIAHLPGGLADQPQTFGRAAQEDVAADAVAAEQPGARLAHRVEPLQPQLKPQRNLFRARILLRILGQQQAGFEISEPRRHHEIIGGDLELQRPRFARDRRDIARPAEGSRSARDRPSALAQG